MIDFLAFSSTPPSLKQLPLKRYQASFSLNRLAFGVDSIHIDVHLSPQVHSAVKRAVAVSMIKHSRAEDFLEEIRRDRRENEKLVLKQVCTEVLREGIQRAKSESEVQIDLLGQFAIAKMVLEETRREYRRLVTTFEVLVRDFELSRKYDEHEWLKMKAKLAEIKQNQKRIVRLVGEELFQVLADVQAKNLKDIRESQFPPECILPDTFFINPTLHSDEVADDVLLVEAYVLLGQRSAEPDNYQGLKAVIDDLFGKTDLGSGVAPDGEDESGEAAGREASVAGGALDPWLMEIDNIDLMFNWFDTREQYKKAREGKQTAEVLLGLRTRMKTQKRLLRLFYRRFKQVRLVTPIVAAYEMKTVYRDYCPPLRPVQVREYLVNPGSRKSIVRELKRRRSFDGRGDALTPLRETIRRIEGSSTRQKQEYLLSFLKDFLRYHRDRENGRRLNQAMGAISLVADEKTLLLSKKNRLLYEFPLPEERVKEEKPVIGHVIIKADIRGSMDVTRTMLTRGLNPAAYFSLNFFDPISEIVCDYGASKVFIEGDAIILSIFENGDMAQGYSVARACGLAVSMLSIVRQYNGKNTGHDLPILELGIGICYEQSPPAFLFDGDARIMISDAINRADRLSGCDKRLRKRFKGQERVFNLLVYQRVRDAESESPADDLSLRYNVNGIELDPAGFAKLSREIHLKSFVYPAKNGEEVTLYAGKVPTVSGKYQQLVIREAAVVEVRPESMAVLGPLSRTYYEVCTHPALYEFINSRP